MTEYTLPPAPWANDTSNTSSGMVPVSPYMGLPAAPFEVPTGPPPPAQQPTQPPQPIASNTWTGISKGFGRLLEPAGQAELIEQQAPPEVVPKPGEIGQAATNYALGGQSPYMPQSLWGRVYQNTLADTVASAPLAAIGPGGLPALATREAMNLTGNLGGNIGREMFPNHPVIGGLLGSLAGSSIPGVVVEGGKTGLNYLGKMFSTQGSVQRQALSDFAKQPAYNMPMSEIDDTLANQNGAYWTPNRINAASELNKRQAAAQYLPQSAITAPTPSAGGLLQHMMGGIGLGAGEILGNHFADTMIGHGMGGIGLAAGEAIGNYIKPYMQHRADLFNQQAEQFLQNNPAQLWQLYQQQQPGILSRLGTGVVAPASNGIQGY